MAHEYRETITTGYAARMNNSLKGCIGGLVLLIASCVVLYINEGRTNVSVLAERAQEINSIRSAVMQDVPRQSLIWSTGLLTSHELIGDDGFLVPGNYIAINRLVEMYAWVEEKESKSHKNRGGSETIDIDYAYKKRWTENQLTSDNFKYPQEHHNPIFPLLSKIIKVREATLGDYNIDMTSVTLPDVSPLILNEHTSITDQKTHKANDAYLFVSNTGNSTYENPEIGDIRIRYSVLPSGIRSTIFGAIDGDRIVPYSYEINHTFYRIFSGTYDQALKTLHAEHKRSVWLFRLAGFIMMWIGLALLLSPISVVLDIVPFVGSISATLIALITFFSALILTIITIIISLIAHSLIAVAVALAILVGLVVVIRKRTKTQ